MAGPVFAGSQQKDELQAGRLPESDFLVHSIYIYLFIMDLFTLDFWDSFPVSGYPGIHSVD